MGSRTHRLARLFCEMCAIALFVIGGGYAILAAAEDRFARKLKWLKEGELMEMLPVFQMVPGILAGHTAVYLGRRIAGVPGAAVALLGAILPSVFVFTAVSVCYPRLPLGHPLLLASFTGLRASLAGILAVMALRTGRKALKGIFSWCLLSVALVLLMAFGIPPGWVILGSMAAGIGFVRLTDAAGRRVYSSFWAIPLVFLVYGLIAFGGGYVLVPVYIRDFVGETARYLRLAPDEFANVMALTQMTPGPIGVNCATFFGYRMGGFVGAVVATLALVLPGTVILLSALRSLDRFRTSAVVRGVFAGVRPVALALLVSATWSFARMSAVPRTADGWTVDGLGCVLVLLSALAFGFRRLGAVATILVSAALAVAWRLLSSFLI